MANQVLLFLQDLTISDTQVFTGDKTVGFIRVTDTGNFTVSKGSTLICNGLDVQGNGVFNIESGGVFVVMKYGITTEKCENFVFNRGLEDSAELYMNPEIRSNRTPNILVNETVKVGKVKDSDEYDWWDTSSPVILIEIFKKDPNYATAIYKYNISKNAWEQYSAITEIPSYSWMKVTHTNTVGSSTITYTFGGMLANLTTATYNLRGNYYNGIGISWPSKIYFAALFDVFQYPISLMVNRDTVRYTSKSQCKSIFLSPFRGGVLLENEGNSTTLTLSYKDLVWDPFWKKRRGELQETTVYAANNMPVTLEARNNILMNSEVLNEPVIGFE